MAMTANVTATNSAVSRTGRSGMGSRAPLLPPRTRRNSTRRDRLGAAEFVGVQPEFLAREGVQGGLGVMIFSAVFFAVSASRPFAR